jgi:hypothetical protein
MERESFLIRQIFQPMLGTMFERSRQPNQLSRLPLSILIVPILHLMLYRMFKCERRDALADMAARTKLECTNVHYDFLNQNCSMGTVYPSSRVAIRSVEAQTIELRQSTKTYDENIVRPCTSRHRIARMIRLTPPVPSAQIPRNTTSKLYATFSARLQCCLDENGESISREADFEEMNPDKHRRHIAWTTEEDSFVIRQFLKKGP